MNREEALKTVTAIGFTIAVVVCSIVGFVVLSTIGNHIHDRFWPDRDVVWFIKELIK